MTIKHVIYNGQEVELIARKGGWTTIINTKGMAVKVRNGEVSEFEATKPAGDKIVKFNYPKAEAKPKTEVGSDRLLNPDLTRYVEHDDVHTMSGRKAVDVNDYIATKLRGLHIDDVYEEAGAYLAKMRGLNASSGPEIAKELKEKYAHLNNGMQRMNVGNYLRGEKTRQDKAAKKAK